MNVNILIGITVITLMLIFEETLSPTVLILGSVIAIINIVVGIKWR